VGHWLYTGGVANQSEYDIGIRVLPLCLFVTICCVFYPEHFCFFRNFIVGSLAIFMGKSDH
jgi:hypothetical protein